MKKKVVVSFLLFVVIWLYCNVTVAVFKGYSFNKFINNFVEEDIELRFEEESDRIYLWVKDDKLITEITIDEAAREKFYEIIKDYQKMERRAIAWQETYDKELGIIPGMDSCFHKGSSWYNSKVNIAANFFSQSVEWHQMILFFSEMHAIENKNMKRNQFAFYFNSNEIKELKKLFSKRAFSKYHQTKVSSEDE